MSRAVRLAKRIVLSQSGARNHSGRCYHVGCSVATQRTVGSFAVYGAQDYRTREPRAVMCVPIGAAMLKQNGDEDVAADE
jgi:hypothetical protein